MTEETQAPAADAKGPGEKLHDAAVALLIAGRVASVDVYEYIVRRDEWSSAEAGTELHTAAVTFITAGEALGVDLVAYLRNKATEIAEND